MAFPLAHIPYGSAITSNRDRTWLQNLAVDAINFLIDLINAAISGLTLDTKRGSELVGIGVIVTGVTQPLSLADALFAGYSAGGSTYLPGGAGTDGIVAASFANAATETGVGVGQAGLGSAPAGGYPYPWPTYAGQDNVGSGRLLRFSGDPVVLGDLLSTAVAPDTGAVVSLFLSYRSDLAANLHWRGWFYYQRADGLLVPFTPDTSINCWIGAIRVATLNNITPEALRTLFAVIKAKPVLGREVVTTAALAASCVNSAKLAGSAVQLGHLADMPIGGGNAPLAAYWFNVPVGGGGAPDVVTLIASLPVTCRLLMAYMHVSTAVALATAQLRDGVGTNLSDSWACTLTGLRLNLTITALPVLASGSVVNLHRSDSGIGGQVVLFIARS